MSSNVYRKLSSVKAKKSETVLTRVFRMVSSQALQSWACSWFSGKFVIHLKTVQSMRNLQNWRCFILARMVGGLAAGVFTNVLTEALDMVSGGL